MSIIQDQRKVSTPKELERKLHRIWLEFGIATIPFLVGMQVGALTPKKYAWGGQLLFASFEISLCIVAVFSITALLVIRRDKNSRTTEEMKAFVGLYKVYSIFFAAVLVLSVASAVTLAIAW